MRSIILIVVTLHARGQTCDVCRLGVSLDKASRSVRIFFPPALPQDGALRPFVNNGIGEVLPFTHLTVGVLTSVTSDDVAG